MEELDELTIKQAANKDAKAFKRLYDHYVGFVWKVIYRTVNGDKNAATEIVQDTFVRVHGSLKSFSFKAALSTWIYRIAFNAANTYLAKNKRMSVLSLNDVDALPSRIYTDTYDDQEMVKVLLDALSPEERFLITSREVEGIPFNELARITGRTSESLRTQLSRLKEKLRATFEKRFSLKEAV
jgi:RNA polymerase sigma-70 factor (ECF subfamily)